jgi:hypothetical protein
MVSRAAKADIERERQLVMLLSLLSAYGNFSCEVVGKETIVEFG